MKKAEIFARVIKVWPEGVEALDNLQTGEIISVIPRESRKVHGYMQAVVHTDFGSIVTRSEWEAERTRIADNQQATQEAREIARTRSMTSEEQDLADIACGKRSKEDQELWDKVALASTQAFITGHITHFGHENVWQDTELVSCAADYADAFMEERAKRMKG